MKKEAIEAIKKAQYRDHYLKIDKVSSSVALEQIEKLALYYEEIIKGLTNEKA